MSLKNKILLIIIISITSYLILVYFALQFSVLSKFESLERKEAIEDLQRSVDAINNNINQLTIFTNDWAAWDDTYAFVVNKNDTYIKSNLNEETFADAYLNNAYIFDTKGKLVWGKNIYEFNDKEIDFANILPKYQDIAKEVIREDNSISGIVLTKYGALLISADRILNSEGEGSVRGVLILGRFLTNHLLNSLKEQTHVDFTFWPMANKPFLVKQQKIMKLLSNNKQTIIDKQFLNKQQKNIKLLSNDKDSNIIIKKTDDYLYLYAPITDIKNQKQFLVEAKVSRDITEYGYYAMWFAFIVIILSAPAAFIVLIILVYFIKKHDEF